MNNSDGNFLSLDAAVKLMNSIGLECVRQRLAVLGETESGAYNFYASRVKRSVLVSEYDCVLAEYLCRGTSVYQEYHEVGAGWSTLPLLLGLTGLHSVGIEFNARRHAGAVALRAALSSAAPTITDICELLPGAFPDVVAERDTSNSLIVSTNLIATTSPEAEVAILYGFRRYRKLLMNVSRFLINRDTDEEREALVQRLTAFGFLEPTRLEFKRIDGVYYLFSTAE